MLEVRLNVNVPVPVFFKNTVREELLPASIDPQSIVLSFLVQALSAYTLRSGVVVIVPEEVTSLFMLIAASVVAASVSAATVSAITISLVVFVEIILCPSSAHKK